MIGFEAACCVESAVLQVVDQSTRIIKNLHISVAKEI